MYLLNISNAKKYTVKKILMIIMNDCTVVVLSYSPPLMTDIVKAKRIPPTLTSFFLPLILEKIR